MKATEAILKKKKKIKRILFKSLSTKAGHQRKFWFLRYLNAFFITLRIHHFQKKLYRANKHKYSKWSILFRKIQSCKLALQGEGNLINLVYNLRPAMLLWEKFSPEGKSKFPESFNISSKLTWSPWSIHWLLVLHSTYHWSSWAICLPNWLTGLTLRKYPCYNVQVH